jgi:protein-tyrosine phosphatase
MEDYKKMKINLEGADNARDFVGITNAKGDKIISRGLIRSNNLHTLTEEDIRILREEYNLVKVIDLRTTLETEQKPDVIIEGVEYIHIPIFSESAIGITHEVSTDMQAAGLADIPDMAQLYINMVKDEECYSQISRILRVIINNENGAVLWHCTEGKDRCGIISALVLYILGIESDKVLEDYLATNISAAKRADGYCDNIVRITGDKEKALEVKKAFMANEHYINAALGWILENYDSVIEYIEHRLDISENDIARFRNKCFK